MIFNNFLQRKTIKIVITSSLFQIRFADIVIINRTCVNSAQFSCKLENIIKIQEVSENVKLNRQMGT